MFFFFSYFVILTEVKYLPRYMFVEEELFPVERTERGVFGFFSFTLPLSPSAFLLTASFLSLEPLEDDFLGVNDLFLGERKDISRMYY